MKKKRIIAALIAITVILCVFINKKDKPVRPDLSGDFTGRAVSMKLASEASDKVSLTEESMQAVLSEIKQTDVDYEYSDLYDLPEVKKRMNYNPGVKSHSAEITDLDSLTAERLTDIVFENNKTFLKNSTYKYEKVDDELTADICGLIVRVMKLLESEYPEADWAKVCCSLSDLKILNKTGMLAYAQVESDLVLSVSQGNMTISQLKLGDSGYRNVLVHEIVHLVQIGCPCERTEALGRRAGISVYWEDFPLNTADWTWFIEGSAERIACGLTGSGAISYQYKMDYMTSYDLSVLFSKASDADSMEMLSFKASPLLLFELFGCGDEKQKDEVLKMMISTEILQAQPSRFFEEFKEKYGYDPSENEEELNKFGYRLKADICLTLTKEFYENLAVFLTENEMTYNDVFFCINIFEGQLNQHLRFTDENRKEINEPFIVGYTALRDAFFLALSADNSQTELDGLYHNYKSVPEEGKANASLGYLPEDKKNLLLERAEWLCGLYAADVKVP